MANYLEAIKQATLSEYPKEMCGIVTFSEEFIQLPNLSDTPESSCEFPENILQNYEIKFLVHSHTQTNTVHILSPSTEDISAQCRLRISFLISGFDGISYFPPVQLPSEPNPNYEGREYIYAISDCFTLVEDFYFCEFSITLETDKLKRATRPKEMPQVIQEELLANGFQQFPFTGIAMLQHGDVVISSTVGVANHVMIFVKDRGLLHQLKTSEYTSVQKWFNRINTIWRLPSVSEFTR